MSKLWYYVQDGKQFGPMPADVLHQLALAGVIKHNDKVRMEDMKEWAQAGSVKGLFLDISGQVSMPTLDGIGKAAEAVSSVAKSTGKVVDNVWEWTSTNKGAVRVICGGSWNYNGDYCTASNRHGNAPDSRFSYLGFRLIAVP